jgi:acyl-coenzyme A synthetase/AMP-(fatty) acid ligase
MTRLLGLHGADDLVAFGDRGPRSAGQLLADAAVVAAALPEPTAGSHVLLVFQHDRYLMAVALLASFHRGHAVTLPPNTRRDSIFELSERPETVAILHDTEAGIPLKIEKLLAEGAPQPPLAQATLPPREVIATVFTSGTTSAMTPWPKTAGQLLGEAWMLGESFGVERGARLVGTVPPGHIYGLLYTVLLPMLRGASFLRETPLHAEAIGARVAEHRAGVLVTVPTHLRSFEAVDPQAMCSVSRVFASTAPLPEDVAASFLARHGVAVTEVLGSTETGGIAWRARTPGARFSPLPEVEIAVDPEVRLLVDSPFVDPRFERPFLTADLAELDERGTFVHLGRADGVVKVGGKRVSLPAVEEAVREIEGVNDAALVSVDAGPGRGAQILAAIAANQVTASDVRAALLARFDPSCLPRRCVFVESLPREDNGKLARASLLRLFGLTPGGKPIAWEVEVGPAETSREEDRARHEIPVTIPEHFGFFDGHFTGYPILPGAAQLTELVVPRVRELHPELGRVAGFRKMKFLGRIEPGDRLRVLLDVHGATATFEIRKASEICSAGALDFHSEGS